MSHRSLHRLATAVAGLALPMTGWASSTDPLTPDWASVAVDAGSETIRLEWRWDGTYGEKVGFAEGDSMEFEVNVHRDDHFAKPAEADGDHCDDEPWDASLYAVGSDDAANPFPEKDYRDVYNHCVPSPLQFTGEIVDHCGGWRWLLTAPGREYLNLAVTGVIGEIWLKRMKGEDDGFAVGTLSPEQFARGVTYWFEYKIDASTTGGPIAFAHVHATIAADVGVPGFDECPYLSGDPSGGTSQDWLNMLCVPTGTIEFNPGDDWMEYVDSCLDGDRDGHYDVPTDGSSPLAGTEFDCDATQPSVTHQCACLTDTECIDGDACTAAQTCLDVSEARGGLGHCAAAEGSSPCDAYETTPGTRDPWLWPHTAGSIWNMPLGSEALLSASTAFNPVTDNPGDHLGSDVEYIVKVGPSAPRRAFLEPDPDHDDDYWGDRCPGESSTTTFIERSAWPVPATFTLADAADGHTPNNCVTFVQPDGDSLIQINGTCREDPLGPVYGWVWPVDLEERASDQGLTRPGVLGAHGGSHLSGLGGSIRPGELTTDADPIHHALKLNVFGSEYLHYEGCVCEDAVCAPPCGGYTWPAVAADANAASNYHGTDPQVVLGALLAIPSEFTPESLNLATVPGQRVLSAMQTYGVYLTDDSAWEAFDFPINSDALAEFEESYGYSFNQGPYATGDALDWYLDMMSLIAELRVVENNAPDSVGGGGTPLAPLAPTFGVTDTTPPGAPTGLVVSQARANALDLAWEAPGGDEDILGYVVESRGAGGWVVVAETWGRTYVRVVDLEPETRYPLRVRARDKGHNVGGASDTVEGLTLLLGLDETFNDLMTDGWNLDASAHVEAAEDGGALWFGSWAEASEAIYAGATFYADSGFVLGARLESSAGATTNLARLVFLDNGADDTCYLEISGAEANTIGLGCVSDGVVWRSACSGSYPISNGPTIEVEVREGPTATAWALTGSERTTLCAATALPGRGAGAIGIRGEWMAGFIDDVVVTLLAEPVETGATFDYPVGEPALGGHVSESWDGDGWYDAQDFTSLGHCGEDWNAEGPTSASDYGRPVLAAADGVVTWAGDAGVGWGDVIVVEHLLVGEVDPEYDIVQTQYAHLSAVYVAVGEQVMRGERIGLIGDAWGAWAAHLHFELRWDETQSPGGTGYDCLDDSSGMTDPSAFIDTHRPE